MADPLSHSRHITVSLGEQEFTLIQEAAAIVGETVAELTQHAASSRARALLDGQRHVVVSERAFRTLAADLAGPGVAVPALQELFGLPRIPVE